MSQPLGLQLSKVPINNVLNLSQLSTSRIAFQSNRNLLKKFGSMEIISDCLKSIDIFSKIADQGQQQQRKIIRDVQKLIQLSLWEPGDIVYQIGSKSQELFLVINGSVSAHVKVQIPSEESQKQPTIQYKQIDTFDKGSGFGQGQFITQKNRNIRTVVKGQDTVLGSLRRESFHQIIQNYKLRVYYRKRNMFSQCLALGQLNQNKIQFIANNAKPINYKFGQRIVKEGDGIKYLFLVSKGQVRLIKQLQQPNQDDTKIKKNQISLKKSSKAAIMMGIVNQGEFIGDTQLILETKYPYSAYCHSQKAEMYSCDTRIILSQMTEKDISQAYKYYSSKHQYHHERIGEYIKVRKKANEKRIEDNRIPLTKQQICLKKKIARRYIEDIPSIIGQSTPRDIQKLIKRKSRLANIQYNSYTLPKIDIMNSYFEKKKNKSRKLCSVPTIKQRIKTQQTPKNKQSKKATQNLKQMVTKLKPIKSKNGLQIHAFRLLQKSTLISPSPSLQMQQINEIIKKMRSQAIYQY